MQINWFNRIKHNRKEETIMSTIKNQIGVLLQKEMDRKDFLKYAGGIVLAAIGVTGLVRLILGSQMQQSSSSSSTVGATNSKENGGYGSSAYGG